ncbi:MAG: cytochrome b [Burkholderiaceae bacterium]
MTTRYTATAISLHWLMALMIIATFALGFYMADLPLSPRKLTLYSYHKWAGATLLALAVIRLAWRLTHPAPLLPAGMGALQRGLSHGVHVALYLLMIAIPLSGWLMSSAQGFPVVWFGILPLPDLVAKNAALGDLLKQTHVTLNYVLLVLVAGHMAAAVKHHFWDKDDILRRMLAYRSQS